MVEFRELNLGHGEIHCFGQTTAVYFSSGSGSIQVDFKDYHFIKGNILFFTAGQYLKIIDGNLQMKVLFIHEGIVQSTINSHFLFRHVVGVGHIKLTNQSELPNESTVVDFLKYSVHTWERQNPFKAKPDEIELLFRLKETVDQFFDQSIAINELMDKMGTNIRSVNKLVKQKIGITPKGLIDEKRFIEARKKVIFSDRTTKEIAYEVGFEDPKYFSRYFKKKTNMTPQIFRTKFEMPKYDSFEIRLHELIEKNYQRHRNLSFYSDKLGLTSNALARKVKQVTGTTLISLIRKRLLIEAKDLLKKGNSVSSVAYSLGFEEPAYFSYYFNRDVGVSPSDYLMVS